MKPWEIYKDNPNSVDMEYCPAERIGKCLCCGQQQISHHGWSCDDPKTCGLVNFGDCRDGRRYLTQAMKDSVEFATGSITTSSRQLSVPIHDPAEHAVYTFLTAPPKGCCPCGIPLASKRCTYHGV